MEQENQDGWMGGKALIFLFALYFFVCISSILFIFVDLLNKSQIMGYLGKIVVCLECYFFSLSKVDSIKSCRLAWPKDLSFISSLYL